MSGAMAFLAGIGTGYIDGKKRKQDQDRLDAKEAREKSLFDAQMDKINQDKADRTALKYAGETVTARPLDGPQPEAAYVNGQEPTQPIGYISGNGPSARTFAGNGVGQEQAAANAVEQNKPGAWETRASTLARQGNVYAANALDVEDKQVKRGRDATTFEQAQTDRVNLLKKEGVFDAAAAMRRGDASGFEDAFNKNGDHKVSNTTVKQEVIDVGGQKVPTFTYTFDLQLPDGTVKRETRNSHTTSMALMPYEKILDQANKDRDFKLRDDESKSNSEYRKRTLAIQGAQEARAKDLHRITMASETIPPAVKLQATSLAKQMEGIGSALNKAMAEDNFNPQSDNAKRLLEQQAALGIQYANLLKDFVPAAKTGNGLPDASAFDKKPAAAPTVVSGTPPTRPAAAPATTPAAVARTGVVAQKQPSTLDQIQTQNIQALAPMAQQFKQAEQMFLTAAKSGNQAEVTKYMGIKEGLRAQLEAQAAERFGNGAPAILKQLYAQ